MGPGEHLLYSQLNLGTKALILVCVVWDVSEILFSTPS